MHYPHRDQHRGADRAELDRNCENLIMWVDRGNSRSAGLAGSHVLELFGDRSGTVPEDRCFLHDRN